MNSYFLIRIEKSLNNISASAIVEFRIEAVGPFNAFLKAVELCPDDYKIVSLVQVYDIESFLKSTTNED